ncbi:hypothetical protein Tco_0935729 [Tanacetum coccineum]
MTAVDAKIGQMSKVLQERGFGSLPNSTETNPRDHVKSILTAKAVTTEIPISDQAHIVSGSQFSNVFSEIVPFPRRLYDYCCDERKEACKLKILEIYSIRTTLHDNTLPKKEKDLVSFTLPCFTIIDNMDKNVTSDVVLGMTFCKKFVTCRKIMEKFAREEKFKQIKEE